MILRPNYFVGIQVSNPEVHYCCCCFRDNISLVACSTVKSLFNIFIVDSEFENSIDKSKKFAYNSLVVPD
jgi:hypothetical protein